MKKLTKSLFAVLLAALMLLSLTPTATASWWDWDDAGSAAATPLALDIPAPVHIPDPPRGGGRESKWFKFTPEEDGEYWFVFKAETLGVLAEFCLYSGADESPHCDDSFLTAPDGLWNRWCKVFLEKDMTYYCVTTVFSWFDGGDYTVTVTQGAPDATRRLTTPKQLTINYHERIYLEELLKGSTIDFLPSAYNVRFGSNNLSAHSPDDAYFDYFFGVNNGTGNLSIVVDGETVEIEITVEYSPLQQFCVDYLGGWWWMKYTPLGEFSLAGTIKYLFPGDGPVATAGRIIGAIMHDLDARRGSNFWRTLFGPFGAFTQFFGFFGLSFIRFPHEFAGLLYWPPEIYPF